MPAEWERHQSTWLAWPKDPLTFPAGEVLAAVEQIYSRMISALSEGELVNVLVDDERTEKRVRDLVDGGNVRFHRVRTADVWIRDYGPIFVRSRRDRSLVATKWRFNAWGNKYEELIADDEVGLKIGDIARVKVVQPGIVLEGGSIDTDGFGTCITTEQCLLNKNRNPALSRKEIERYLLRYLGFSEIVWLSTGIVGDDTDGHVDDLTRFVAPATVITMVEDDPNDENHRSLAENLARLKSTVDSDGRPLRVIELKMPRRKLVAEEGGGQQGGEAKGSRLPASYANFYIGNSTVLVPTFGDVNDGAALDRLSRLFPGRRVVGINCEKLVYGFGGIHCVTQQQPL